MNPLSLLILDEKIISGPRRQPPVLSYQKRKMSPQITLPNRTREHLDSLEKQWVEVICLLGITLTPIFGILDYYVLENNDNLILLPRFLLLRGVTCLITIGLLLLAKKRRGMENYPSLIPYVFTLTFGGMVSLMTAWLGGFDSNYYAGIILVIISVNLFLPWSSMRSLLNGLLVMAEYLAVNLVMGGEFQTANFLNNMFFLASTLVIAVTISHYKYLLIIKEFESREQINEMHTRLQEKDRLLQIEIDIAGSIQEGILPPTPAYHNDLKILSYYSSLRKIGGDFFDMGLTDNNELSLLLADVSGHGIPAALLTTMVKIGFNHTIRNNLSPADSLVYLNELFHKTVRTPEYMTALCMSFSERGRFSYANAGHQHGILIKYDSGKMERLESPGMVLGILSEAGKSYSNYHGVMAPGDRIFIYTDGITDTQNRQGEEFSRKRLCDILQESRSVNLEESKDLFIKRRNEFMEGIEAPDDASFLLIERTPFPG